MHDTATLNYATQVTRPWYQRVPLYVKILIALILGVAAGELLPANWTKYFNQPALVILKLLGAIAAPLILVAVMRALLSANIPGRTAGKLFLLLTLNTLVAITIGLLVANVIRPGRHASLPPGDPPKISGNPFAQLLENIPGSLLGPLVENNVIGVIIVAVTFALAARRLEEARRAQVMGALNVVFDLILIILHWIIALVPLAVFCKVAYVIGTQGFKPFVALGWFIVAVLVALMLQGTYYLTSVRLASWVRPLNLVRGTRDALAMAFSTSSSTATMPVTYACLVEKVGIRPASASLGALVGSNFNNDGTALYEAMAALFIAQMIGVDLTFTQQLIIVVTSVVASVGAAGIPEAGLVTMTLVFGAVHLPTGYIALLIPIDWFLDRCRTAINVMGDMNVSCVLEGKTREADSRPVEPLPESTAASFQMQ